MQALFFRSGKGLRTLALETTAELGARVARARELGALPLLVFSAGQQPDPALKLQMKARGIDVDLLEAEWPKLRRELARASTRSQHFTLDATHTSLVTDERNAEFIVAKVGQLYDTLASAQATAASN